MCPSDSFESGVQKALTRTGQLIKKTVVRYRVKGLEAGGPHGVIALNKLIAKISRTELADMFVRPAPQALLDKLLEMVCVHIFLVASTLLLDSPLKM